MIYRQWSNLFVITAVVALLSIVNVGVSADPNSRTKAPGSKQTADGNDANGPTVALSYNSQKAEKNSTLSFMYFVPLISPTLVEMETSANNEQQASLVSYERKVTSKSFYVSCEFEMRGKGFFKTIFNPPEVIAICLAHTKKDEPMTNALDYIKFDGEGLGRIDVRGTISGSTETVTEVDIHFNARGQKSPVTIGLYSIDPKDGQYKYENRYNELVTRVATLTFRKSAGDPTMGVKIVSVNKVVKPNRFIGRIKGVIANFFIDPPRVSKLGNDTMLNFGHALLKQRPSFVFPKAENLKATRTVATDNKQK